MANLLDNKTVFLNNATIRIAELGIEYSSDVSLGNEPLEQAFDLMNLNLMQELVVNPDSLETTQLNALTVLVDETGVNDIPAGSVYSTPSQYVSANEAITGLLEAGANIVITGSGTATDPYVIKALVPSGNPSFATITGSPYDNTALGTALDSKQATLPTGSSPMFLSWDKTMRAIVWSYIGSTPTTLAGYGISQSDTLFNGKYIRPGDAITGYALGANRALLATDTWLQSLGILQRQINNREVYLGVPPVNGYVLASTTTGVRTWVAQSGGGGITYPLNATGAINETSATLASASTVNIGAAAANAILITGTTTITAFDSVQSGAERTLTFAGALTLTHNGTSLILPTGANITTAAGDVAVMQSLGSGNWRCVSYQRADGTPLAGGGLPSSTAGQTFQNQAGTVVATDTLKDSNEDDVFNIPGRTIYNEQGQPVLVGSNGGNPATPPILPWGINLERVFSLSPYNINDPEVSEIYTLAGIYNTFLLSDPGNYDVKGFNYVSQDLGLASLLYIKNGNSSATLTLKNLDGSVDPDQQIQTLDGNDLVLAIGDVAFLIYDVNFKVVSVSQPEAIRNFKLTLSSSDIISGGTFDIPQLAAPGAGFAWQIQSASLKYDFNSFANSFGEVEIFANGAAASQFTTNNDPLTLTASWWGNMVSSQMNKPSNTDIAIVENAKMTVVLGFGSLSFDGTATVYGTATLITV